MPTHTSLHSVLDEEDWNLEDIKTFLANDSSSVDEANSSYDTPLIRILENEKCSLGVVTLLVNYGADVNYSKSCLTPLFCALNNRRNVDIINLLLVKGARMDDIRRPAYGSAFCSALNCSMDVIRLLLNAGCLSFPCIMHNTALHCVINCMSDSEIDEGVLRLLFERRVDVNAVDVWGRSVMCYALRNGIQAKIMKLLLEAGAVLKCEIHTNPFLCATNFKDPSRTFTTTKLKTNLVQLLLEKGACVNIDVLRSALAMVKIEIEALGLLLDCLQGMDIITVRGECNNTLLHDAADNIYSNKSVVKLLVKRGVRVDSVDNRGETALHKAASAVVRCVNGIYWTSLSSVVKTLLKRGAEVNLENAQGETSLYLAIEQLEDSNTLKMLLAGGAHFGINEHSLLKRAFDKCDAAGDWQQERRLECCKMLLKFYFVVENPHFDFQYLIEGHPKYEELSRFGEDCVFQMQKLDLKIAGQDRTLREFLSECSPFQVNVTKFEVDAESFLFNRLLRLIAENVCPLFFDVIVAKVGRPLMKIKVQKLQMYTYISDESRTGEKVVLNSDIVCQIAHLLTDDDLLKFISAFSNKTNDHSRLEKVSSK